MRRKIGCLFPLLPAVTVVMEHPHVSISWPISVAAIQGNNNYAASLAGFTHYALKVWI